MGINKKALRYRLFYFLDKEYTNFAMNKKTLIGIIIILLVLLAFSFFKQKTNNNTKVPAAPTSETEMAKTESSKDASMFPKDVDGMVQTLIHLDPKNKEREDYQVELYAEKTALIDCNTRGFAGTFEKVNLQGWGYNYYTFKSSGFMPTTMMACPKGSEKEGIVKSRSLFVPYNSKLPLVVYAHPEYTIKYRIWSPQQ